MYTIKATETIRFLFDLSKLFVVGVVAAWTIIQISAYWLWGLIAPIFKGLLWTIGSHQ